MMCFVNPLVNLFAYGFLKKSLILADDYPHSPTPFHSAWHQRSRQACYAIVFFVYLNHILFCFISQPSYLVAFVAKCTKNDINCKQCTVITTLHMLVGIFTPIPTKNRRIGPAATRLMTLVLKLEPVAISH